MKVGIVADTHDNLDAIRRAVEIFNDEGIELLIHAGDFVAPFTEQSFRMLNAPLVGIFGNTTRFRKGRGENRGIVKTTRFHEINTETF
ncbi:MAG: metallophosphoesterase family protein [Methanophagales archaeon]|nr:metallophosphoesterase family protein [Methanophagales archaeon]